ncbi:type II toxin-antitoxin system mRNA interferase toxin, RelE/StbE family [filamentous cyanobacterium CCP3]|nr:type II toxin-antitoxin system mRNA interferase toxin, RelE/StbE family [filamentous cyanobacterium CCP3]
MSYEVLIKPAAQRQIKKLPRAMQADLIVLIEHLAQDPRPSGCKKLKGRQSQYRVRLGDYRVIYSIEEEALVVRVIKVGHRRDIYEEP